MAGPRIRSFAEFWPYYVGAHRKPLNRALHCVGTSCALACAVASVVTVNPLLLLAAPVIGYGPAWVGHFLVEGNRPASFDYARYSYARYSLMADFKMLGCALRGKLDDEVIRLFGSSNPAPDAPLRATR